MPVCAHCRFLSTWRKGGPISKSLREGAGGCVGVPRPLSCAAALPAGPLLPYSARVPPCGPGVLCAHSTGMEPLRWHHSSGESAHSPPHVRPWAHSHLKCAVALTRGVLRLSCAAEPSIRGLRLCLSLAGLLPLQLSVVWKLCIVFLQQSVFLLNLCVWIRTPDNRFEM